MTTYAKIPLNGGTDNGLGTLVTAIAIGSSPTTIHTGGAANTFHEVWIYANNTHSSAVTLTLGFGGVATKDLIQQSIAATPSGLVLVCAGLILKGNATALVIKAAAGTASVISLFGFVNTIA